MPDQFNINGTDFLAHERAMHPVRAPGLHGAPKNEDEAGHPGRVGRVRATLGRRLISWARRLLATMSPPASPRPGEAPSAP